MDFENLTAILDFAIQKEVEAAEFYTDISKDEVFSGAGICREHLIQNNNDGRIQHLKRKSFGEVQFYFFIVMGLISDGYIIAQG